jgi:hypothetical protein
MTKGDPTPRAARGHPSVREQEHEAAHSLMRVFSRFGSKTYAYKFEPLGKGVLLFDRL